MEDSEPRQSLVPAAFREIGPKEVVQAFLRKRNENTRSAYQRDLESFAEFLDAPTPSDAAEILVEAGQGPANAMVLAFQSSLAERYAAATVNRRIAAVKSLVKLARVLGVVSWDLTISNVNAKPYKDTAGPGEDGFVRLLKAVERSGDGIKQRRDTAILHLLFGMALRRQEVVALDVSDVDWDKRKIMVKRKRGNGESVPLTMPPTVEDALLRWINLRGVDSGPLFISLDPAGKGDGRLSPSGLWRVVRAIGESIGLKVWPHALRHAGVTAALDATNDIRAVQRFSGHARLDTLQIYDDNRKDLGGQVAKKVAEKISQAAQEATREHDARDQAE